jgi:hypothetical protein
MSLPNLPPFANQTWVDKGSLELSTGAAMYMDEMFQTLNTAVILLNLLSDARVVTDGSANRGTVINEALKAPQKTTAQITAFASDADIPNGTIWFDTDDAKLKVKTASGTIETITSS